MLCYMLVYSDIEIDLKYWSHNYKIIRHILVYDHLTMLDPKLLKTCMILLSIFSHEETMIKYNCTNCMLSIVVKPTTSLHPAVENIEINTEIFRTPEIIQLSKLSTLVANILTCPFYRPFQELCFKSEKVHCQLSTFQETDKSVR